MNTNREKELLEIAQNNLENNDKLFHYFLWDVLIEENKILTYEEYEWLKENVKASVLISKI